MNEKDELQKWHELEKEYENVFEEFIKSDDEKTFSKTEVKKIIEAHIFREVVDNTENGKRQTRTKNLLVTSRELGAKIFNIGTLVRLLLTYLFNIGFLLLINEFIYPDLFQYKSTVFIIAIFFTLIDKLVKPFLFIADLISFTILKIGVVTLAIYTAVSFVGMYLLNETITIEKSIIIAFIILICMTGIEYLKKDSPFKTKYIDDDEIGSEEDE